jgi:hypothetical protein
VVRHSGNDGGKNPVIIGHGIIQALDDDGADAV